MQTHEEHLTRLVDEVGRLITANLLVEVIDDVRSIVSIARLIEALSPRPANEAAHGAKRDVRPGMEGDHAVDAAF